MTELVPEIRFGGFTEPWEQRKLGEVADRYDNLRIPITASERVPGSTPYYGANGIQDYVEGFTHQGEFVLIAEDGASDLDNYPTMCINGIIWVNNHAHVIQGRKGITDNHFIAWSIKRCDIKPMLTGGTRAKLNAEVLMGMRISTPNHAEQISIGSFFEHLDSLITLHQRKYDKLVAFKKALLEKMFPKEGEAVPEIRFAGFTDPWEQRKLNELATMHARIGWQNLRKSEFLDNGDYLLITGTDFENGFINYEECHYVKKERYDQDPNIQIHDGSILLTKDGTIGKVAFVQALRKPATLNAGVFNIVVKKEKSTDARYLYHYLKGPYLIDYIDRCATGGTIKHLNQDLLVNFPVLFPDTNEQKLIGTLLSGLDNLITLHQCKYSDLKL